MKGMSRLSDTKPTIPLQIRVVKELSLANRRVIIYCTAKSKAVTRPKNTPTGSRPALGRIISSTPPKAVRAATHREILGGSFNIHGAMANTMSGAKKLMAVRSEEHTSELQSRGHLVCRLLLEKK